MTDISLLPDHPLLGRTIVNLDARSKEFAARGAFFAAQDPLISKTWRRPRAWDQGQTSQCVGYSMYGMANTQPLTKDIPLKVRRSHSATDIYVWAQNNDEWPGVEPSYFGTSTLAGVKALKEWNVIQAYRWGFGTEDTIRMLGYHGPVVIGINWYDGMFDTDANGFVEPSGPLAGGHAIELHGVNVQKEYVEGTNSWGPWWGLRGRFRMRFETLRRLLREDGECVTFDMVNSSPTGVE